MAVRVKRSSGKAEAVMAERKIPGRTAGQQSAEESTFGDDLRDGARSSDEAGRLAKPQRQHRIARLLEQNAVSSQGQLVDLLGNDGVVATQATVSRDLEDMGAVKVRVPGGELVYAIPELPTEQFAPEDHLRRVFSDWVVDVAVSLNIVVLRTPPGSAHVVASALDRARLDEMVGTVAGDDTILVIASESVGGAALAGRLRTLAGL
jgi:transcriptional regulator of arginine metabolism